MIKVTRIGESTSGMMYQSDNGRYYADIEPQRGVNPTELHTVSLSTEIDGEPNEFLTIPFEITNPYTEEERGQGKYAFEYMLLSRLKSDCEYYINHYPQVNARSLWAKDEAEQIECMCALWRVLPVKPEWITMEIIKEYAKKMGVTKSERVTYVHETHEFI